MQVAHDYGVAVAKLVVLVYEVLVGLPAFQCELLGF